MASHPNRSRHRMVPGRNPRPEEIVALRTQMGLTQTEFGRLLYATRDGVAKWESGDRRMRALDWEIVCLLHMYPGLRRLRKRWRETLR